jgi:DNA-binding phage protein
MPKRTKSYHSWLLQKLTDPARAKRYLKEAIEDSPEMFLKGLRNVAEARGMSKVAELEENPRARNTTNTRYGEQGHCTTRAPNDRG